MRFTMAQPEVSCHPETLLPGRADGRLGGALLLRARRRSRGAGEGRLPRYTWRDAYAELREQARRARPAARRRVPRARGREPARRPGGRGPRRRRLLRQEHDADHAPLRLVGRARNARHRRRARADAAARARLRLVHALHRGLPDRRARRARRARRDALPLVLDAGAGADPGGVPRGARRPGLRLRHLPGRLPVEPRRREAARRRRRSRTAPSRVVSLVDWLEPRPTTSSARATTGSTCPGTTRATCGGTRSSRSGTPAARALAPLAEPTLEGDDELLASTRAGRSTGSTLASRASRGIGGAAPSRASAGAVSSAASSRALAPTPGRRSSGSSTTASPR